MSSENFSSCSEISSYKSDKDGIFAIKFLESLEDNEDIQNVYSNVKFIEN